MIFGGDIVNNNKIGNIQRKLIEVKGFISIFLFANSFFKIVLSTTFELNVDTFFQPLLLPRSL